MLKQVMVPRLFCEVTSLPQTARFTPSFQQPTYPKQTTMLPPIAGQEMSNFTPNGGAFANMAYVPEPAYPQIWVSFLQNWI